MNITVIGGGNIGTLMAAEFAAKKHNVTVYTPKVEKWSRQLIVYNPQREVLMESCISCVTDCMETAVKDADYIWIVLPAFLFSDIAQKMLPYVQKGQKIGVVPGSGGAEFAFGPLMKKGCVLFGLQRVHSIARLKQYGKSVYMLGRKSSLQLAAIPAKEAAAIGKEVEELFDIPTEVLPNYLCVTLTPSNPILHTTRLYSMFRQYNGETVYERNILFYEEWDDASSEILFACDDELQQICQRLERLDLTSVQSLPVYYESPTVEAMTKKISNIPAFKGLLSPMKQVADGWKPDFDSRYFQADFLFGLKIIKEIGQLAGVKTPHIDLVWDWYRRVTNERDKVFFEMPCADLEEFYDIYR